MSSFHYQQIPILAMQRLLSSPKTAVPVLAYLKIRATLIDLRGKGGEFWLDQELADNLGYCLRNLRENVNKGVRFGWYRKCKFHKGRYEIVSTQIIGQETTLFGEPMRYMSLAKLPSDFLFEITWKTISRLKIWANEHRTSEIVKREVGIRDWRQKRRLKEIEEATGLTTRAAKRVLKKENRSSGTSSSPVLTSSLEQWSACAFQGQQLGYHASTICRHRHRIAADPVLSKLVHYSIRKDLIAGYGAVHRGYNPQVMSELNWRMDTLVEQGKVKLPDRGKHILYRGQVLYIHISKRKLDTNLDLSRNKIKSKYLPAPIQWNIAEVDITSVPY